MKLYFCCLTLLLLGGLCASAMDSISIDQLPTRVKDALKQSFKEAEVLSAEKDNERNDFVYYLIQIKHSGQKKKIEINENGLVSKVEVVK